MRAPYLRPRDAPNELPRLQPATPGHPNAPDAHRFAFPFPATQLNRLIQFAPHKSLDAAVATTMASLSCAHLVAAPSLLSRTRRPALPRALVVPRSVSARLPRRHWGAQAQSEKVPGAAKAAAAEEDEEATPSWAKPGTEELPPWARNEAAAPVAGSGDLPFPVYLIGSCLVAIAAVGSIFEYFNQNPLFGVVQPDNPVWAPILGVFVITGFPTAGFLFYKAISLANKASEEADRADGYDP